MFLPSYNLAYWCITEMEGFFDRSMAWMRPCTYMGRRPCLSFLHRKRMDTVVAGKTGETKGKAPLPIDDSLSDDGEDGFCTLWSRLGFVPNLALIYSAVWSRLKILMLGSPWTEEPTYNKTVTFNAFGDGISVCFVKNSTNDGCITVSLKL